MARVVLAMSGGVDSSVAAWLLKNQGHEVVGLFMRTGVHHDNVLEGRPNHKKGCCSALDAADARLVADRLDLPFYALDFAGDFARIMDDFAHAYAHGRTPNPCVQCNVWLKFGKLWEYGRMLGADFVATGHYAQTRPTEAGWSLHRGRDAAKDQSYVLFGIDPAILGHLLFPVGGSTKSEIREIARTAGLPVHAKPDSVEVCFVPDGDAAKFVRSRLPDLPVGGTIRNAEGELLGEHRGVEGFTVGQRKGLALAGKIRRYVLELIPATGTVVIGTREQGLRRGLVAENCNWFVAPPREPFAAEVQFAYRDPAVPAQVIPLRDGLVRVEFATPQFGIAPGQAAVWYAGDRVLGGGWIKQSLTDEA